MPLGSDKVHYHSLSQWLRHARLAKSDAPTRLVPTRLRRYTDFPHDRRSQATLVVALLSSPRSLRAFGRRRSWCPRPRHYVLRPRPRLRRSSPGSEAPNVKCRAITASHARHAAVGSFESLAFSLAESASRRSLAAGSRLCLEFLAPARNSEKTVSQPRHEVARSSLAHVSSSGLLRDSRSRSLAPRIHRLACPTRGAKVRSPRPPATPSLR